MHVIEHDCYDFLTSLPQILHPLYMEFFVSKFEDMT